MTGKLPTEHGIVANGWYFRDLSEVWLWRQSAKLYAGERIWEAGKKRDSRFTCAKMFWWYNMYDTADWAVTPRPMYPADGRKLPDVWAHPGSLRDELNEKLGTFPLFNFWGPRANIESSRWIANSARYVFDEKSPTLTLVYLPHLDYGLQVLGPEHPDIAKHVAEVDELAGELIEHFESAGAQVIVLSEYAIVPVSAPIHVNRLLREHGLIAIREELGHELLDAGASTAFAVADHQIAHVYVQDAARIAEVKRLLEADPGIERVLDATDKAEFGLDHVRSGELVALAKPDRWFTYYFWLDDRRAPDYARTVDIHRKPGYDPVELFVDPDKALMPLRIAGKLALKKLGQRTLLDVIPLDASLVKGSHGRVAADPKYQPVFMSSRPDLCPEVVDATAVKDLILEHIFGE
jgi:predicted AlkP superfamily pyrophosphatase or phosphodiesterase